MASETETRLIEQIKGLSLEELLWLAALVDARAKELRGGTSGPTWSSLAGTWTHDPDLDAQDWIRKLRDETEDDVDPAA